MSQKPPEFFQIYEPLFILSPETRGFINDTWVGFEGFSGALKSISCMTIAHNWMALPQYAARNFACIYVTTEHGITHVINQSITIGRDLRPFQASEHLYLVDMSQGKNVAVLIQHVKDFKEKVKRKWGNDARVLLVIDSVSEFWSGKGQITVSRSIWDQIHNGVATSIDLAAVVMQMSTSTGKAFGVAAEYGVDTVIQMAKMFCNGQTTFILHMPKMRMVEHSWKSHVISLQKNSLGQKFVNVERIMEFIGNYDDFFDAIQNLKWQNKYILDEKAKEADRTLAQETNKHLATISKILAKHWQIADVLDPVETIASSLPVPVALPIIVGDVTPQILDIVRKITDQDHPKDIRMKLLQLVKGLAKPADTMPPSAVPEKE